MPYIFEEDETTPGEVGYDIRLPENWVHFDLTPELLQQRRAEALRQMGADAERVRLVDETFDDWHSSLLTAQKVGLIDAAGVFERYDDGFLLANLSVFRFEEEPGTRFDPLQMIRLMHPDSQQTAAETWLRTGTIDIDGIGPCARVEGVVDHEHSEEVTIRSVVAHTIAKVSGTRYWLMVSCTSPNVLQSDGLLDLFDAITGTLSFWSR